MKRFAPLLIKRGLLSISPSQLTEAMSKGTRREEDGEVERHQGGKHGCQVQEAVLGKV
jgi:hypothetical protein